MALAPMSGTRSTNIAKTSILVAMSSATRTVHPLLSASHPTSRPSCPSRPAIAIDSFALRVVTASVIPHESFQLLQFGVPPPPAVCYHCSRGGEHARRLQPILSVQLLTCRVPLLCRSDIPFPCIPKRFGHFYAWFLPRCRATFCFERNLFWSSHFGSAHPFLPHPIPVTAHFLNAHAIVQNGHSTLPRWPRKIFLAKPMFWTRTTPCCTPMFPPTYSTEFQCTNLLFSYFCPARIAALTRIFIWPWICLWVGASNATVCRIMLCFIHPSVVPHIRCLLSMHSKCVLMCSGVCLCFVTRLECVCRVADYWEGYKLFCYAFYSHSLQHEFEFRQSKLGQLVWAGHLQSPPPSHHALRTTCMQLLPLVEMYCKWELQEDCSDLGALMLRFDSESELQSHELGRSLLFMIRNDDTGLPILQRQDSVGIPVNPFDVIRERLAAVDLAINDLRPHVHSPPHVGHECHPTLLCCFLIHRSLHMHVDKTCDEIFVALFPKLEHTICIAPWYAY